MDLYSVFSMGSPFSAFPSLLVHFLCWFPVYIIIVPGSLAVNKQVVDVCGGNITNRQCTVEDYFGIKQLTGCLNYSYIIALGVLI